MELSVSPGLEFLAESPCKIFDEAKSIPQSLSLSTLVTMEMLKALRLDLTTLMCFGWDKKGGGELLDI